MGDLKLTSASGSVTLSPENVAGTTTIVVPSSTATLATIADVPTSIVDNGNATAITIDASENVDLADAADLSLNAAGGAQVNRVQWKYNGTPYVWLERENSTGDMVFGVGGASSEKMRLRDGGGITFNGDTAAANALDDYEEGTWTPSWVVANGSVSSYHATGKYTKIGRTVFLWGYLSYASQSGTTGSDQLKLGGLPFTPGNGWGQGNSYAGGVHAIGLYTWGSGKAPDHSFFWSGGSSHPLVRKTGTTDTSVLVSDLNTGANWSQFRFQGQYNTA